MANSKNDNIEWSGDGTLSLKKKPKYIIEFEKTINDSTKSSVHVANTEVSVIDTETEKIVFIGSPSDCLSYVQAWQFGILVDERLI